MHIVGLGDNILCHNKKKSMSKAICIHMVSIVNYDLYHLLKLAQDCLFVRLGMFLITTSLNSLLI